MNRNERANLAAEAGFPMPARMNGQPAYADIGTIISVGANLIGASMASDSADNAVQAQQQATDQATGLTREQYAQNRADLEPWRTAGGSAVTKLSDMLALSKNTGQAGYGDLTKKFTLADFWDDPITKASYQSGLEQGTKAIDSMAASRGMLNSGSKLKALARFTTDYTGGQAAGSQARFVGDQTNQYNRLAGVAGTGQTAATNTATFGQNSANTIGGMLTAQGNARGAAAIARGNVGAGAVNNVGNTLGNYFGNNNSNYAANGNFAPYYTGYGAGRDYQYG